MFSTNLAKLILIIAFVYLNNSNTFRAILIFSPTGAKGAF